MPRNTDTSAASEAMSPHRSHEGRAQLVESSGQDSQVDARFVERLLGRGIFFWLDLDRVPSDRLSEFSSALRLDAGFKDHLVDTEQRSCFTESHQGVRWVSYAMRDEAHLTQVRGIFTKSFLVTVHDHPCRGLGVARHRYERLVESDQDDGPLVFFMVLDALVNSFEPAIARLDSSLDELEARVLGGQSMPQYLQSVFEVRQALTPILRALGPYRRDLVGLLGDIDRLPAMQAGSHVYFEAHRSHLVTVFEAANDCRDETRDAMEAFGVASSARQGEVINWLTIVATVFLPLTFVTGYFGMNIAYIRNLHGTWTFLWLGLVLPCLLALGTIALLRYLLRRQGIQIISPRVVRVPPDTATDSHGFHEPRPDPGASKPHQGH